MNDLLYRIRKAVGIMISDFRSDFNMVKYIPKCNLLYSLERPIGTKHFEFSLTDSDGEGGWGWCSEYRIRETSQKRQGTKRYYQN